MKLFHVHEAPVAGIHDALSLTKDGLKSIPSQS
jgi:hypothetical protein